MIQGLLCFIVLVWIFKWEKKQKKRKPMPRQDKDFHNDDEQYFLFEEFLDPRDNPRE